MKQPSITKFFSAGSNAAAPQPAVAQKAEAGGKNPGKPKNKTPTTSSATAAGKKRSSEVAEGEKPSASRKRLRKLSGGDKTPEKVKVIQHAELEDSPGKGDLEPALDPKSASRKSTPRKSPKKKKSSSGRVTTESSSDVMEVDSVADEGSDASSISEERKLKKKKSKSASPTPRAKKKPSKKVEGVGTGSMEAASLHSKFDLDSMATWAPGKPVPYQFLVDSFERISETTKRLEIAKHLTDTFRAIVARTPEDLLPAVYLCVSCVAPAHTGVELGIGDAILIKSIAEAMGKSIDAIKEKYEATGDLGLVAVKARRGQGTLLGMSKPLNVKTVFETFGRVAKTSGDKSQDKKKGLIKKLLADSKNKESGYIIRSLQGKLRIGLAEQTVLLSLGHAIHLERDEKGSKTELAGSLESAAQAVKKAFCVCPSYDQIVPVLLEQGTVNLDKHIGFVPGVPVRPMLAKPTNGISEVLDKFSNVEFTCEYKYDGERAQIHMLEDGSVRIYSRNAEDTTAKYPDIVQIVQQARAETMTSAVLDAEAVAFDENQGILPFQVLSTRARKDVALGDIKVKVCVFCFDCLYLNGETLLEKDLTIRRKALYSAIQPSPGRIDFASTETSRDVEELQAFLDKSVEQRTEGLIVKTLDATYEPSKRSLNWLKLKKDYLDGCGDTFDVVPIGAWHGKGKRTGVFGSYLLAIYDPESEEFQTISKIGTGFSDEELTELAKQMNTHKIANPKQYYSYADSLTPEVWFEPKVVWEVKAADLSISPVHQAAKGLVDVAKGISIRFPRLVRVRDDKTPEAATSAQQVADMYREQPLVKDRKSGS